MKAVQTLVNSAASIGALTVALASAAAPAFAQTAPAAPNTIVAAIQGGAPIVEFRTRYESADQDGVADADAFTFRTRLGWQTAKWRDLQALIEFEDIRALSGDYNDGVPPGEPYATIADPETTDLNRLQLAWTPNEHITATLGRQRVNLDDQRFVGSVAWRQDEQTLDALRLDLRHGKVSASYLYVDHVNRIFADALDWDSDTHLINAAYAFAPSFKLTGFAYLMDFEGAGAAASNATYGVRATGTTTLSGVRFDYAASYAAQKDYGANPNTYEADYFALDATATRGPLALRAGYESLEGEGAGRRFQTPLATLHAFNGWADVFLNTPNDGLEDLYGALTYKPTISAPHFSAPMISIAYHTFEAERTGADLGDEIDVIASASITPRLSVLAKYATYDGPGAPADVARTWFGFEFKL